MRGSEKGIDVRADAEEGHVADVEQAGEADDDVEPEGPERIEAGAREHARIVVNVPHSVG